MEEAKQEISCFVSDNNDANKGHQMLSLRHVIDNLVMLKNISIHLRSLASTHLYLFTHRERVVAMSQTIVQISEFICNSSPANGKERNSPRFQSTRHESSVAMASMAMALEDADNENCLCLCSIVIVNSTSLSLCAGYRNTDTLSTMHVSHTQQTH
jgi:hypothetical protein